MKTPNPFHRVAVCMAIGAVLAITLAACQTGGGSWATTTIPPERQITLQPGGPNLLVTNLTGHPQVVLPNGFLAENAPHSISFVGRLHDEATLLGVAKAYQDATGWHRETPPGF